MTFAKAGSLLEALNVKSQDGWWVGVVQALAIVPGVSRSGSTITGALFLGMERETAAKFSFLLGLPARCRSSAIAERYSYQ